MATTFTYPGHGSEYLLPINPNEAVICPLNELNCVCKLTAVEHEGQLLQPPLHCAVVPI